MQNMFGQTDSDSDSGSLSHSICNCTVESDSESESGMEIHSIIKTQASYHRNWTLLQCFWTLLRNNCWDYFYCSATLYLIEKSFPFRMKSKNEVLNLLVDYFVLQIWRGNWQGNDIVAKILALRECTVRNSRDFKEEYPRLRYEKLQT